MESNRAYHTTQAPCFENSLTHIKAALNNDQKTLNLFRNNNHHALASQAQHISSSGSHAIHEEDEIIAKTLGHPTMQRKFISSEKLSSDLTATEQARVVRYYTKTTGDRHAFSIAKLSNGHWTMHDDAKSIFIEEPTLEKFQARLSKETTTEGGALHHLSTHKRSLDMVVIPARAEEKTAKKNNKNTNVVSLFPRRVCLFQPNSHNVFSSYQRGATPLAGVFTKILQNRNKHPLFPRGVSLFQPNARNTFLSYQLGMTPLAEMVTKVFK